jgi:sterol desaturase/sphingolipid hydroxylase (fatty acid hydroxylase superfamily)
MSDSDNHWLVRAKTIRLLWVLFIAILVVTVLAEFLIHKHEYFGLDGSFGFSAWYGFITCVAMVAGAKLLGYVLKRKEDYYDD